jgi:hypothetical protein
VMSVFKWIKDRKCDGLCEHNINRWSRLNTNLTTGKLEIEFK